MALINVFVTASSQEPENAENKGMIFGSGYTPENAETSLKEKALEKGGNHVTHFTVVKAGTFFHASGNAWNLTPRS